MDHNERHSPRNPVRDGSTMSGSPTSGPARQLARNKGLAWVSAITLGTGAAGLIGAVGIAASLPSPTTATVATTSTAAAQPAGTSTRSDEEVSDDSSTTQQAAPLQAAPLQAAPAPATSNTPPVATSGAS